MRWGSSDTDKSSGCGGRRIETVTGPISVVTLLGGARWHKERRMDTLSAHSQLLPLLSTFSSQNPSQFPVLQSALDDVSRELVSDKSLRSFHLSAFTSGFLTASLIGVNIIESNWVCNPFLSGRRYTNYGVFSLVLSPRKSAWTVNTHRLSSAWPDSRATLSPMFHLTKKTRCERGANFRP